MAVEYSDLPSLKSQLSETNETWIHEMERHEHQVSTLQEKLVEVTTSIQGSKEDGEKELDVLRQRVKTTATLLTYLKSKARVMALPDLEGTDEDTCSRRDTRQDSHDQNDEATYIEEMLQSIHMVTDVMETLVKRVILAESKTAMEKEKVCIGQEEIKKKAIQIENMSIKLEKMESFALGTKAILEDMKQRIDDLVEEITRQTQRAEENEQELSRVKRDFESLKAYVSSLMNVRETLVSSEKQFQTMERLFERLVAKTTQLEGEKMQKESEVQKLMEENVKLTAQLDKKEAQLLAMNEQCKVMALGFSNV
ncbi:hypothetical protein LINGRAHAP2_LOCUS30993 [Linum grandiflorum]